MKIERFQNSSLFFRTGFVCVRRKVREETLTCEWMGEGGQRAAGKTLGEGIDPLQRGFLRHNPHQPQFGNFVGTKSSGFFALLVNSIAQKF